MRGGGLRVFLIGGLMSYRAMFGWMNPWIYVPALLISPAPLCMAWPDSMIEPMVCSSSLRAVLKSLCT